VSKKKRADAAPEPPADALRVAAHPRASASIRRLRGWAGLAALAICALLSLRAGVPLFDAVARGLLAGVAAQFVVWFAGLLIWRQLIVGELAAHRDAAEAARAERRAAAEAAQAAAVAAREQRA
jgi:hypothetical protein